MIVIAIVTGVVLCVFTVCFFNYKENELEFKKKENIYELKNSEVFFKLIRDSFTQKRKTLRNNLKGYNLDSVENTLKKYNLDLSVRAEQLPLEIFVEIANNL